MLFVRRARWQWPAACSNGLAHDVQNRLLYAPTFRTFGLSAQQRSSQRIGNLALLVLQARNQAETGSLKARPPTFPPVFMRPPTLTRRLWLMSTVSVTLSGIALPVHAGRRTIAVVVNPKNRMSNIDLDELRRVFLGKRINGPGGDRLTPFNHRKETETRTRFDEVVLGMSPEEVERYWIDQRIRGGAKPPRSVSPVATLLAVVAKVPTAIAYAPEDDLTNAVRVIDVDGKAPGDDGYAITF